MVVSPSSKPAYMRLKEGSHMLGIHPDSSDWLYASTDSLFQMLIVWLGVEPGWPKISGPLVCNCVCFCRSCTYVAASRLLY